MRTWTVKTFARRLLGPLYGAGPEVRRSRLGALIRRKPPDRPHPTQAVVHAFSGVPGLAQSSSSWIPSVSGGTIGSAASERRARTADRWPLAVGRDSADSLVPYIPRITESMHVLFAKAEPRDRTS